MAIKDSNQGWQSRDANQGMPIKGCQSREANQGMPIKDGNQGWQCNLKLVKAIVCAGLYPNVAKMKPRKAYSKRPPLLSNNIHRRIQFHPKSVNASPQDFDQQWFIYHLLMKVSSVYIYDSTMIPPYPLLFFGGVIDIRKDHGQDCIIVDEWIVFRSSRRIAHLVRELRVELDKLLEYKITHPGVTNWNPREKEGALMRAITDLITTEEHKGKNTFD